MEQTLVSIAEFCRRRPISRTQFYEHRDKGTIGPDCFGTKPGGKRPFVILERANSALDKNARWHAGGEATRRKFQGQEQPAPEAEAITEPEIKKYLSEDIEALGNLDMLELQKRSEIEKILAARLKRRRDSREVIDAEQVQTRAFEAGKNIKESCLAIPDRVSPLMAAEPDAFKCKKILLEEINYILEGLAETLQIMP